VADKPDVLLSTVRASALPLAFRCPASVRRSAVPVNSSNEAADNGTAAHAVLRSLPGTDRIDWDAIPDVAKEHGADPDETRMLVAQGTKLWNQVRDSFAGAYTEVSLKYELPGCTLTGHADLLAISQTSMRVGDWKTGRKDADHSHQFKAYATMSLLSSPDIDEATGTGLWVRDQEIENYTLERRTAGLWLERLKDEVIAWDGVYRPGKHCGFCPRNHECEAANAMIRRDVAAIADKSLVARVECELALMDPGEIIATLQKADLVVKFAARVREAIRTHVQTHGDVVADGVRLTTVEESKRELDPLKTFPILTEQLAFQDEDLARVMKLSVSKIEEVIRDRAPKGEKGREAKKLGELLEASGAVTRTTTTKLKEIRQ
jgi:hypothetical protein